MTAPTATPLRIGDPAPDQTVLDTTGAEVRFSDYWSAAPKALALVFIRHFG